MARVATFWFTQGFSGFTQGYPRSQDLTIQNLMSQEIPQSQENWKVGHFDHGFLSISIKYILTPLFAHTQLDGQSFDNVECHLRDQQQVLVWSMENIHKKTLPI